MASSPRSFALGLLLGATVACLVFLALGPGPSPADGGSRRDAPDGGPRETGATTGATTGPAEEPAATPRPRSRSRLRTRTDAGDDTGEPAQDVPGQDPLEPSFDGPGILTVDVQFSGFGGRTQVAAAEALQAEWNRARSAAGRTAQDGDAPDRAAIEAMLRSDDGAEVGAALVQALAAKPPLIRPVLDLARDESAGFYRALALLALSRSNDPAASGDEAFALVKAATRADDVYVRQAAAASLARFGKRGQDVAMELLRSAEFAEETAGVLAGTIARAGREVEFLRSSPPAVAGLAVIEHLGAGRRLEPDERSRAVQDVTAYLRQVLRSDALRRNADPVLDHLVALGAVDVAAELAARSDAPFEVRIAAAFAGQRLVGRMESRTGVPSNTTSLLTPLARLLADHGADAELLRQAIGGVDARAIADPDVLAALLGLAASHGNAWVREDARAVLARFGHATSANLRIAKATYGKNGKFVDVTDALRELVTGGRLSVRASNGLGGDPLVGTRKDLRVEYVLDGRRRVRRVAEGEMLVLP